MVQQIYKSVISKLLPKGQMRPFACPHLALVALFLPLIPIIEHYSSPQYQRYTIYYCSCLQCVSILHLGDAPPKGVIHTCYPVLQSPQSFYSKQAEWQWLQTSMHQLVTLNTFHFYDAFYIFVVPYFLHISIYTFWQVLSVYELLVVHWNENSKTRNSGCIWPKTAHYWHYFSISKMLITLYLDDNVQYICKSLIITVLD